MAKKENEAVAPRINQTALARRIAQWTAGDHFFDSPIDGLTLHFWDRPTDPTCYLLGPSLCLIAQGRKQVLLGEEVFVYDADHYLVTSVDLPVVSRIIEASPEVPYLGLTLMLDPRMIGQLMLTHDAPVETEGADRLAIAVGTLFSPLLDALVRLLDLLETPRDMPVMEPLIKQEILYRLLTSEQGPRLRRMTMTDTQGHRISKAIDWLKTNFSAPVRVDALATMAGLSPSAFHSHFRAVTAMSPLQYQKHMRLGEARRLMLTERMDASTAAFRVGYESPSQFSREYSRMFGAPPARDIKTLIHASGATTEAPRSPPLEKRNGPPVGGTDGPSQDGEERRRPPRGRLPERS
jgi:AraC-like DNA-binding protein